MRTNLDLQVSAIVRAARAGSEEFRKRYRAQAVPRHYSGTLHCLLEMGLPLAGMLFCLWQLVYPSGLEFLTIPITFLYANLAEYLGHRGPMHRRIKGFGSIFRHVTIHHGFYVSERPSFEQAKDLHALLLPPATLLFFAALAIPAGLLLAHFLSPNVCFLFLATALGYYLSYELLHTAFHAPDNSWVARLPPLRKFRQHHLDHHNPQIMMDYNFNIAFPVCDFLLGTLRRSNKELTLAAAQPQTSSLRARSLKCFSRLWIPPRIQFFEFGDQPWLQGSWREAYLDGLNFLFKLGRIYRRMDLPYSRWVTASRQDRVLDLASGGAGHIDTLFASARQHGTPMPRTVILSDLYPDYDAYRRLMNSHPESIDYLPFALDASASGASPVKLLSLCTAIHHFPPAAVRRIVHQTTKQADGIFVMDAFHRNLFTPLLPLVNLLPAMAAPFFSKRLTLKKIVITTVLPIIPLMLVFDGIVSALRSYRTEELLDMIPSEFKEKWHWEHGMHRYLGVFGAPYLFGCRK